MPGRAARKQQGVEGRGRYAACQRCWKTWPYTEVLARWEAGEAAPDCGECGGPIKSKTISFGQSMPAAAMIRAEEETLASDLFIAIGSSLVVYPAAGFPEIAARKGTRLVILNREATGLDPYADLVLHKEIGVTLGEAVGNN